MLMTPTVSGTMIKRIVVMDEHRLGIMFNPDTNIIPSVKDIIKCVGCNQPQYNHYNITMTTCEV